MGLGLALSHNAASSLHFLGDLEHLVRRHKVSCGQQSDLEGFASALSTDRALQGNLFNLCTAISHMSPKDLTEEQLLLLVVRAVGGRALDPENTSPRVRSAFLATYAEWTERQAFAVASFEAAAFRRVAPTDPAVTAPPASRGMLLPFTRAVEMRQPGADPDGSEVPPLSVQRPQRGSTRPTLRAMLACLVVGGLLSVSVVHRQHRPVVQPVAEVPMSSAGPAVPQAALSSAATAAASPVVARRTVVVSSSTLLRSYAVSTPAPAFARHGRAAGAAVDVQLTIAADGRVREAHVLRGDHAMRAAALRTVRGWRFKPYRVDGTPVPVIAAFDFKNSADLPMRRR